MEKENIYYCKECDKPIDKENDWCSTECFLASFI